MVGERAMGIAVCPELHHDHLGLVHGLDVQHIHESRSLSPLFQALEEPYLDRRLHSLVRTARAVMRLLRGRFLR